MKGALHPRAEELLVERTLRPLDQNEQWELEELNSIDDDSFDKAAAAIVIATSAAESLPQHLAAKILASAPQPDLRRTLPGVIVQPPEASLPRDTMVGVEIASFDPNAETAQPDHPPERSVQEIVIPTDFPPGNTGPIATQEPVVTFSQPRAPSSPPIVMQPIPLSRHTVTAPPPGVHPPLPAVPAEIPVTDHLTTIPPPKNDTLPPPRQHRTPAQPSSQPPRDKPAHATGPLTPQPSRPDRPDRPITGPTPQMPIAPTPQPYASQPSQPYTPPQSSIPQTPQPYASQPHGSTPQTPQPYASPQAQPFPQREPLPLDTQRQQPPMRGIPLPSETFPPGEAPPIVTPIIDLSARRGQPAPQPKRRSVVVPWLAAAACLLVAGGAVWWALQRESGEGKVAVVTPAAPDVERKDLLALADTTRITWTVTQDQAARGATGDLVWNQTKQTGFMRFVGLTPNDPKQFQYQLWIFDKNRDQAFPVDGGVFDVSSTGEVLVKISPKLAVNDASLFAVTVEKPGGVVVSKRERIVVTATRT